MLELFYRGGLVSGHQQLTSSTKHSQIVVIKISPERRKPGCFLAIAQRKILKRCILYIYRAILPSNKKSCDFQVSSTSLYDCDAAVSWLQSNRGLLLSRQSHHCLTKPLIRLSFTPIMRCISSTVLFDLSRHLYLCDQSSWFEDQQP